MGTIRLSDDFVSPAISKAIPRITLNQKTNQTISAKLENVYDPETYVESFDLVPTTMKYKLHLYINSETGYAHGQLSWTPSSFVNGSYIYENLTVNVTDATPISGVVIPVGYDDYYLYNNLNNFYEDTNYDNYKTRSNLSGNVIFFDLENWLTSRSSASLNYMFAYDSELKIADLSNLNTSKVIDMGSMFSQCSNLISVNLSNFDTSKVTEMSAMFQGCESLSSLDITNFNTSEVTKTMQMFQHCKSLTSLNVTNFITHNVTLMGWMFQNCSGLTSLNVINFNTSNVESMNDMFHGCSSLTSLDLSNFDTSEVIDMSQMFYMCKSLTSLDLSNFDTSKITNMGYMISNCNNLRYLIIGSNTFKFQLKSSDAVSLPNNCKILVPSALISTYQNATNWSAHASKFDAIENYDIVRSNGQVTVTPKNA